MITDGQGWVATLVAPLGQTVSDAQIENLTQHLAKAGRAMSPTARSADGRAADIFFDGDMRPDIAAVDRTDLFIQKTANRRKRIVIADMESTIIEQEMLDELATETGIGDKVAAITRRAMNGELDFASALAERLQLLRGQPESLLEKVAAHMTFSPGAETLVKGMKRAGASCWLVTGGFDFFTRIVAERLGFEGFFTNKLLMRDGLIAGEIALPLLDANAKRAHLIRLCAERNLTPADALAIGDGANDIPMLTACAEAGGLGVAYRAKPSVRAQIRDQINATDLSALLYAQGYASA